MNSKVKDTIRPVADLVVWRRRELNRDRTGQGYAPTVDTDIRNVEPLSFEGKFNYYWLNNPKGLGPGGRPAWQPLYHDPRRAPNTGINSFGEPNPNGWPMEAPLDDPNGGDWVKVVGQYEWVISQREASVTCLRSEQVVGGGWIRGHFNTCALWNLVVVPPERINWERAHELGYYQLPFSRYFGGFLLWAPAIWMGNGYRNSKLIINRDAHNWPSYYELEWRIKPEANDQAEET